MDTVVVLDYWELGFLGSWVFGDLGFWGVGFLGTWVFGDLGSWVLGLLGDCVRVVGRLILKAAAIRID